MAVTVTSVTPAIGSTAGGTPVEIVGSGFHGGDFGATTTVKINGEMCTGVVVGDDTFITCVTPANAAAVYDVTVYTSIPENGSLVGGYTYVAPPVVTSVGPASGSSAGGTAVEITGTGFLASPIVSFAGVVASSIVRVNDAKITCVTPAGPAGAANVYVQNSAAGGGLSDILVGGFTYAAPPAPTGVTPSRAARGDALTITGTAFVSGATVTLGGVACTDVVFVSVVALTCVAPSHSIGVVDVVVTNPDAQTGTLASGFTFVYAITPWGSTIAKLFPPGKLWNFEAGSALHRLAVAIGDEFARVQARGANLVEESDPRTASETLADWEEMLALPDELVTAIPATTAGRRVAIAAKYAARGGQSLAFFTTLCAACGYPLISITRYANEVLRCGPTTLAAGFVFRVNDRVYGAAYAYSMLITVSPATLGALTHAEFEAVVRARVHSHIEVMFTYT
jgi:uncharacterized protein YmfQ (DUF2313 family)